MGSPFLDDFNYVLSIFFFMATFIAQAYVFLSLSFNLDISAVVVLLSYLISTLFRVPIIIPQDNVNFGIVPNIAQKLIWGSLYFFVFEMRRLEGRLKSESFKQSKKTERTTKIQKVVVMSIFILIIIPVELSIYATKMFGDSFYDNNATLFDTLLLLRSVSKLLIDGFMFTIFLRAFIFLVNQKHKAQKERYGSENGRLSTYNLFVIRSALVLFFFNAISSILSIFFWSIYHSSLVVENSPDFDNIDLWYRICFRTYTWSVNFFTSIALLHLFHFQG